MATGLKHHGWQVKHTTQYMPGDLVFFWGIRRQEEIRQALKEGCDVCILERGYIGDRKRYSSVSFGGGLNGRGIFTGPLHDPERFEKVFSGYLKPWRPPKDGYALIMGQVPGDMSVKGVNLDEVYRKAAGELRDAGWTQIYFRGHPLAGGRCRPGVKSLEGDLQDAIAGAALVITYNSNAGVDAMLGGRPVVALDEGSMVYEIAGHSACEVVNPDRTEWAHALAWKQWTKDEMRSGECWEAVSYGRQW